MSVSVTARAFNLSMRCIAKPYVKQLFNQIRDDPQNAPKIISKARSTVHGFTAKASSFQPASSSSLRINPLLGPVSGELVSMTNLATQEDKKSRKLILYMHGGAYVFGSAAIYRPLTTALSKETGLDVLTFDYRLSPEHRYPAALEDALATYRWLIEKENYNPKDIAFAGDSAGGNLVVATLLALPSKNLPPPGAAVCFSPWLDMVGVGESREVNDDPVLPSRGVASLVQLFKDPSVPSTDPLVSPIFASRSQVSHFPPMFVGVGTTEMLLSDSIIFGQKFDSVKVIGEARNLPHPLPHQIASMQSRNQDDGIHSFTLRLWDSMPHVHVFFSFLPEAKSGLQDVAEFLRCTLSQQQTKHKTID